jgi:hypothetical protein
MRFIRYRFDRDRFQDRARDVLPVLRELSDDLVREIQPNLHAVSILSGGQPAGTSNQPALGLTVAIQLRSKAFLDDVPAFSGHWIGLDIPHARVEDFAMPIRGGNGLGSRRDSVP